VAGEHGIDLHQVQGTGPGGRVIIRDIEQQLKGAGAAAPAAKGAAAATAASPAPLEAGDQVLPVSMMRRTIAKRLVAGKNDAPHFYLTVSANMTGFNAWRAKLNEDTKAPKVSVNDLLVTAVSRALLRHPGVNASWEGDNIRQFAAVHLAIAVALPTGLVTPVIRNAHRLGAREIATVSQDLVAKAREGKLGNEAFAGGTFTISNLGMFGIEEFTAIINPPQAAILAVGATIPTPWVRGDQVVVEPRMKMTMSCDHRVVDGAMGAEFLKTLVRYLEDPLMMLA
jgi:pyruvate dehydrogenase E2 component (dihydrolipoamide acetyltransferase)